MKYKLIGLDLDGTTLNSGGQLSCRTQKALREASRKGVHIVIATGRNFSALPDFLRKFDFIEYTVNSNGGEVRDYRTKESIFRSHIDLDGATEVYEFLRKKKHMIEVFVDGRGYIEKADFEDIKRGLVSYRTREYVLKTRTPVDNIFNLFRDNLKNIENINIFFETDDEKHKMRNELKKLKNISVTSSLPENLEIGGENTSKAAGILFVADKLGVDKRQIMCFGDGLNDLEMISMAGMGVAMENGLCELKRVADYVAPGNDCDGVAQVIERFVL